MAGHASYADLPDFAALTPADIVPAVRRALAAHEAGIARILANQRRDFAAVLLAWQALDQALARLWAPINHLHGVANTPELRAAHGEAQGLISTYFAALGQNRELYEAVRAAGRDLAAPGAAARALVEHTLRDFRLAGVALEEPARSRFRQISTRLSELGTEFANAVLDATDAWQRPITDAAELAGLPESARDTLAAYARAHEREGWLVTLQAPAVQAVLQHADDRALRAEVYRAWQTRASDQGPDAGRFDNSARIREILALRHEAAQLLGFASAAERSLATKMARSPAEVLAFERDLIARARPVARRELDALRAFAATELGLAELEAWDISWVAEKLRRARFDLDEEELKPWFPLPVVRAGVFALAERLYGIRLVARPEVSAWHAEAEYWDVLDAGGERIAGLYLDLVARPGKRGGAWMDSCRDRFFVGGERQLPVAFLTCNFPPAGPDRPALLDHREVLTLLHEFGHCLHHMLTRVDLPGVGGINGVEWDAVELPSQFMENFGWDRAALDLLSGHWQSGAKLPDALLRKMLAARHYNAGMFLVRQLEFGLFDFRLHAEYDPAAPADVLDVLAAVRAEVAVVDAPPWTRFPHAFGHIFAGGYAAGYYSYLWAELLSADVWGAFAEHGGIDAATGARFRAEVLGVGATRSALASFVAFRGREPRPEALLASYGLASPRQA